MTSALLLALILLPVPRKAECKRSDYLFPAVQLHPTVDRPFVFLHQRKCGGMSVRVAEYMSGLKLGLEAASFVPCFNPMCKITQPDLASIEASAILACHCNWYTVIPRVKGFACLSSFRHPVSRAVSCLFYKFPRQVRPEMLANMSTTQFRALLKNTLHDDNATCNNEALHMFSSSYKFSELDHLVRNPAAANMLIQEAVLNMQRCTVLVVSDSGSAARQSELTSWNARILQHWFPWIGDIGKLNVNSHPDIPTHLVPVIYELNWPEMQVYNAALQRYKEQQELLHEIDGISVSEHLA